MTKSRRTAKKRERYSFFAGVLIGVLGNFLASFFIEALKTFTNSPWVWAVGFVLFSIGFGYISRETLREAFDAPRTILRAIDRLTVGFIIVGFIMIVWNFAGW